MRLIFVITFCFLTFNEVRAASFPPSFNPNQALITEKTVMSEFKVSGDNTFERTLKLTLKGTISNPDHEPRHSSKTQENSSLSSRQLLRRGSFAKSDLDNEDSQGSLEPPARLSKMPSVRGILSEDKNNLSPERKRASVTLSEASNEVFYNTHTKQSSCRDLNKSAGSHDEQLTLPELSRLRMSADAPLRRMNRQPSLFNVNSIDRAVLDSEEEDNSNQQKQSTSKIMVSAHVKNEKKTEPNIPFLLYDPQTDHLLLNELLLNQGYLRKDFSSFIGKNFPLGNFKSYVRDEVRDISTDAILGGKKVLLFGVPGPFSPICSKYHLPPIIQNAKILKKFIDRIAVFSTNSAFAMNAWQHDLDTDKDLYFFSDHDTQISASLGLLFTKSELSLFNCTMRCSILVDDKKIVQFGVETEATEYSQSSFEKVFQWFDRAN